MKLVLCLFTFWIGTATFAQLPDGFVYLDEVEPTIQLELRYCLLNNFVGEPINGYHAEVCVVTKPTAYALKKVQNELLRQNLSLKIFDAYRPQQAVNHFVTWAKQVNDTLMKQQFYPNIDKRNLFKLGYIASQSRHSSGSTIDLTIVNLQTGKELDMGTPYDFFNSASWYVNKQLTPKQQTNRKLLHDIMLKHGFRHYPKEWWHFTLKGEPFKNQYFNFPVE